MRQEEIHKWVWKMEWCRRQGLPPAFVWVWEEAEKAYREYKRKKGGESND